MCMSIAIMIMAVGEEDNHNIYVAKDFKGDIYYIGMKKGIKTSLRSHYLHL